MKKHEEIVISFLLHISNTTKQNETISNSTLHNSSALKQNFKLTTRMLKV